MNSASETVIAVASPLGTLRLRPEQNEDDAFRFALFCQSRSTDLALLPIEPAAYEQLMRFQYRAQTVGYRGNFPSARFDIIELDGAPIGRIVVDRSGDHIEIVDWAIAPQLRGRGVGTAILRAVMEEARQASRQIRLKVVSNNDAAVRLYLRLGFEPIATIPFYTELAWSAASEPSAASRD